MTESSAKPYSASERSAPRALGERDLHLWFAQRQEVVDSDEFRRRVLSRYAPLAPADWCFSVGPHGKPGIIDPPVPLNFNLSHSGDWYLCAVCASTPIGVDLEHTQRRNDTARLARRFYTEPEQAALAALPEAQRKDRFFDYWTLKEAAVKARGDALPPSLQRRSFELQFANLTAPGEVFATDSGRADPCAYFLFDAPGEYRLAVCWPPGAALAPVFTVYRELDEQPIKLSLRAAPRSCDGPPQDLPQDLPVTLTPRERRQG